MVTLMQQYTSDSNATLIRYIQFLCLKIKKMNLYIYTTQVNKRDEQYA